MKIIHLFILLVSSALLVTGCTKSDKKLKFGVSKSETIITNIQTEPPSLDWNKATDTTSHEVTMNIMDGMVDFDYHNNLKAIPALAESWQSKDNKAQTWTFEIKKGVLWTDGVELEAQHFVDGWQRLLTPTTAAEYAYFLFHIKNAKEYNEGKIKDFSQVGVRAEGKHKLVVELIKPVSFFPSMLVHHSTFPLRKDIVEKFGDQWTKPGNIVTLGAYRLKEWEHDQAILLERNENYYAEKAKTKYVLMRMITEQSSAVNAFDTGELDFLFELPASDIAVLKQRPEFTSNPMLLLQYYGFNTKTPPFDDVHFRRAISHAIDKNEIVKMLGRGDTAAKSWVPVGMFGYDANVGLDFDLTKAKESFAKSKYKDKVPRLTITYNTNENHKRIAEVVQAQLKRNLGIEVEILNEEWKVYLSKLKGKKNYGIYRMGWVADYPDPNNYIDLMAGFSANNHTNWKSAKYDELVAAGVRETNEKKRLEIYNQAQKILLEEDAVAVPLFFGSREYLISKRLKGFKPNALDHKVWKEVSIE